MVLHKQSYCPDHNKIHHFNFFSRRAQDANLVFHHSSSDAIVLHDNMSAIALDMVVSFAGDVSFERKLPTLTKLEETPGDRIDLRISGQPEEPYQLNDKQARAFLTSSLIKQVFKSPNKSTRINDVVKSDSQKRQKKSIATLCHVEILKLLLHKTETWNDMKFL